MYSLKRITTISLFTAIFFWYSSHYFKTSTTTKHSASMHTYLDVPGLEQSCNCTDTSAMAGKLRFLKENSPVLANENSLEESLCSSEATKLGSHQRVISFSLFMSPKNSSKPSDPRFFTGMKLKASEFQKFYPNWKIRIYTHPHPHFNRQLCELTCTYPDIFICDAENLPRLGNISETIDGRMWRFLPLVDPTVDIFISRDLDSPFSDRELAAVNEWIKSNKVFHAMRDNPVHNWAMLAGMWGAKSNRLNNSEKKRYEELLLKHGNNSAHDKFHDQCFLRDQVYPTIKNDLISHDSYFCKKYKALPFPTKRLNSSDFVGNLFSPKVVHIRKECPMECRPVYGKDWTFC